MGLSKLTNKLCKVANSTPTKQTSQTDINNNKKKMMMMKESSFSRPRLIVRDAKAAPRSTGSPDVDGLRVGDWIRLGDS